MDDFFSLSTSLWEPPDPSFPKGIVRTARTTQHQDAGCSISRQMSMYEALETEHISFAPFQQY